MKKFINKILDVPKLIRRLWFLLWILLAILLVMKFCFGIWYPIVVKNENLISFNDYICNTWMKYLILVPFYLLNANLVFLISCAKDKYTNWKRIVLINLLIVCCFVVKNYSRVFGMIMESILLIVIPMIYLFKTYKFVNKFKLLLYLIIVNLLVMAWQLNIYLVRGIDFDIATDNHILIGVVLQLDYYIFLIITWIGVTKMSLFGVWFFSKDITVLKAEREKELKKAKPNMKKIESLDIRIAELEKEGK